MGRPSEVIVLLEDIRHKQLIFRYLRRSRIEARSIRFVPPKSGSGEQWVREQFPIEVRAYRRRSARAATSLIAMIDADTLTLQDRMAQLNRKLAENSLDLVLAGERIAMLIPRRNIETWILCLNEMEVDEQTDYKRSRNDWTDLIRPAVEALYTWTRAHAQIPIACTPSLQQGISELRRLDRSVV
jgi:hypothetical protein